MDLKRRRQKTEEPTQTNMMTTMTTFQGKHSHGPLCGTVIENTHSCLLHLTAHMLTTQFYKVCPESNATDFLGPSRSVGERSLRA